MRPGLHRLSVALAMLALLGGLLGGLVRMGWRLPVPAGAVALHGPLLVLGFLGSLIGLERAVALGGRWWYAAPPAAAAGGLLLLVGLPGPGAALLLAAGLGLALAAAAVLRGHPVPHQGVLLVGALLWTGGVLRWLAGGAPAEATPWLGGFLVLTVAGERLELSRASGLPSFARGAFLGAVALVVAGLGLSVGSPGGGTRLVGLGLLLLAAWLVRFDVARRTVRGRGLPRFVATAVLVAYGWLAAAGLLWLAAGDAGGPLRDARIHALFLGFVMSMVVGHAPVVLPAVLGLPLSFRSHLYAPLALLHGSLLLRVAGDLASVPPAVRWGGLLNAAAVVLFLGTAAVLGAGRGSRRRARRASG